MATCYAIMPTTTPRIPMGRSFLMPTVARPNPKPAFNAMSALPRLRAPIEPCNPLDKHMAGKSRREYTAGESIFSQGDSATAVFYIQSGKVNLTVVSMNGKEAIIAQLSEGNYFGEASLAGEQIRTASANALQTSTIIRIEDSVMLELLRWEPEFAAHFRAHLLVRNNRMEADLVDHLFNSSEKRLARLLMLMANYGQESKPTPDIAKISQESLAEMIGTTRSRVSFFLNRFRDRGYIDYNCGGMHIHSSLVNVLLED